MAGFTTKFDSARSDWETPDSIFVPLANEFGINTDVCATADNHKCDKYYSEAENGLSILWEGICWMNPPFGQQGKWVEKAWVESQRGITTVALLPARTNTNWWHEYCMKGEVRFIKGRPKFKGAKYGLPQPLAIVIWKGAA